jgi:hypothetical protein
MIHKGGSGGSAYLDRTKMDEEIICAAVGSDEAKAFLIVKPFNHTRFALPVICHFDEI